MIAGHYFWNNDNGAAIVCRQLGYVSGSAYTFGVSPSLPVLPIVWGMHTCADNTATSIFECADEQGSTDPSQYGANFDWSAQSCTHSIAQGAICYDDARPSQMNSGIETCRSLGNMALEGSYHDIQTGAAVGTNYQAVSFGW